MPNTFTLIASSTVGSGGASNIGFTSIPATYTDFKLVASLRVDGTFGNPWYDSYITVNSANLSWRDIIGLGSGTPSSRNDTVDFVTLAVPSSGATASTFGNLEIYIPNYAGSNNKSASMDGVAENNATGSAMGLSAGLYSSSSAITSITITPYNSPTVKFVQYSTAYLYGIVKS
jgi:hypothetical protein